MTPGEGPHHDDGVHRPLAQWINQIAEHGHDDDAPP
jgi:hypothetical protein